ncbi:hypothetical protein MF406_11705 [Georgenia sp. TF02-10]|uniref:hypothetical protein n=1 Tax=Georgenia sp. TF02-10 TaxID=2917725 RepID=UPI001FA6F321|nr:hypothetical protein [Georgenia sp. TF02-10]UNX53653.1 hypothetical protein MF406_11705 [Georgenia sp. TF02-10]
MAPRAEHASRAKLLNALVVILGVVTIGVGLYFAAIDRLLLTTAVCLAALIPGSVLAYAASRARSDPPVPLTAERQRRVASVMLAAGAVTLLVGGVLAVVMPGGLSTLLVTTGPGMVLAGIALRTESRSTR